MRLFLRAALLAGIPLAIMTAIGIALLSQGQEADGRATLAAGVIVSAISGSSVIYQIDQWTLRRQTVVHFVIMVLTVLPALFFSGWYPLDDIGDAFVVLVSFLAVGVILWLVFYAIAKGIDRRAAVSGGESSKIDS